MWPDWLLPPGEVSMTTQEAQARQDDVREQKEHLTWFVGAAAGGAVMARAHTSNFQGGELLPGALMAPTLAELRQMMPAGLTAEGRRPGDPAEIIETWWD